MKLEHLERNHIEHTNCTEMPQLTAGFEPRTFLEWKTACLLNNFGSSIIKSLLFVRCSQSDKSWFKSRGTKLLVSEEELRGCTNAQYKIKKDYFQLSCAKLILESKIKNEHNWSTSRQRRMIFYEDYTFIFFKSILKLLIHFQFNKHRTYSQIPSNH